MESVSNYSDTVQDEKMEEQTEIVQNGFSPEEDNRGQGESQAAAEEAASCPVIPKRAALLYLLKHFPLYCLFQGYSQMPSKN